MNAKLRELANYLSENTEVAAKLDSMELTEANYKEELLKLAHENGIELAAADLEPEEAHELNSDELKAVAGGLRCNCVIGGGGTQSEGYKACGCVAYGEGNCEDGVLRCQCIVAGEGDDKPYHDDSITW